MEEYIEKLISQIRCKKARPFVADEIRGHLEDQISANMEEGMPEEDAEKCAVIDMGDPVEVGISMDKIHRPQIAWEMIALVGVISIFAIIVQWMFVFRMTNGNYSIYGVSQYTTITGEFNSQGEVINVTPGILYGYSIGDFILNIIVGIVLMIIIYFIDYTAIAKCSRTIGIVMIAVGVYCAWFGTRINGTYYRIGFVRISETALMMLFVPIYGAIIYKYRGGGFGALLKSVIWLIVPVMITFRLPAFTTAVIMMICMLVQLTVALSKGWFKVNKIISILGLWSLFILSPIISLFGMYSVKFLAEYQRARIRAWILGSNEFDLLSVVRESTKNIPMFGNSGTEIIGTLPDLNRDYIFTYILNMYGSAAGIVVIAAIAMLVLFIFSAVVKQKNELGLSMGVGCGMLILMNSAVNIFCSIGVLPPTASFLPFFSAGGSNTILCYVLIGIVMSIYRYKDVYPRHINNGKKNKMMFI